MGNNIDLKELYDSFCNVSIGSKFYRCELHLHTPFSYDYKYKNEEFCKCKLEDLIEEMELKNLLKIDEDLENIKKRPDFDEDCYKARFGCRLLANEIYNKGIELVVITDHETLEGYTILKKELQVVRKLFNYNKRVMLLPGVEIDTDEGVHIIGIFNQGCWRKVDDMIKVITYYSNNNRKKNVQEVMEEIKHLNGIVYFPHISTSSSNIGLKNKIYSSTLTDIVGVKQSHQIKSIKDRASTLKGSRYKSVPVVVDSDSHSTEEVGRAVLWLKIDIRESLDIDTNENTNNSDIVASLKYAVNQYDRISYENPTNVCSFKILQMLAFNTPIGVQKNTWTPIGFSNELTCFTGERGTGKSSILKLITMMISMKIAGSDRREQYVTRKWLQNKFQRLILFIQYFNEEGSIIYAIEMIPEKEKKKEYDLQTIAQYNASTTDLKQWIITHKLIGNEFVEVKKNEKMKIANSIRLTSLRQSEIEDLSRSSSKLYDYFKLLIMQSHMHSKDYIKLCADRDAISIQLKDMIISLRGKITIKNNTQRVLRGSAVYNEKLAKIKELFSILESKNDTLYKYEREIVTGINNALNKRSEIDIKRKPLQENDEIIIEWLIKNKPTRMNVVENFAWENLFEVLKSDLIVGIIDILTMIPDDLLSKYGCITELNQDNQKKILDGKGNATALEVAETMIELIVDRITGNPESLSDMIVQNDNLIVLHDTAIQRAKKGKFTNLRNIEELSLGQKCVAVTDLIITMSNYFEETGPLVFDQPEDHQDNRYIFQYLVKQLRKMKKRRQIILSTHNANIPVGADAELIVIMDTDGEQFWVDCQGALDKGDKDEMVNDIHLILEGGTEALKNRIHTYGYIV